MTSIIFIFFISLALSLFLTPQVIKFAKKYKIEDAPCERKVHKDIIPRGGGIAIYLSFILPFSSIFFYSTQILDLVAANYKINMLAAGASFAFLLGLWDDVRGGINAKLKFAAQILIALLAYQSGLQIKVISLSATTSFDLGMLSLPITVFWFLLVINAMNLIDGLDGLAAGVSLFVSLVLLVICATTSNLEVALGFAALAGSTLGFLKYNFNPASIFMGDSGSYFLGYILASLSIMGALKGPTTVAMLIPIISLGLPLMDVMFSPIRRFIVGKGLFDPDKNHMHHMLLKMGFTHRNAVLLLYGITILTGILSILIVHGKNDTVALVLFILGATMILGIRKLGYVNYFNIDQIHNWVQDITYEMGITRKRRNFLQFQIDISESQTMGDLWKNICKALEMMRFDKAEMRLEKCMLKQNIDKACTKMGIDPLRIEGILFENQEVEPRMTWEREKDKTQQQQKCLLKMELPLMNSSGEMYGFLCLIKNLGNETINSYTLRRVEHLRRTVLVTLQSIMDCD